MKGVEMRPEQSAAVEALARELQNLDSSAFPALHALAENVKIRTRVEIPQAHVGVNFVGKLLGPGGKTLRAVQETTKTKMAILGAGSLRDDSKEKELLSSGDPKFQHLKQKIHLQVDSLGPPSEAYYRMAHALSELRKIMTPEPVDGLVSSQQQAPQQGTLPWIQTQQAQAQLGIPRGSMPPRAVHPAMCISGPISEQYTKASGIPFRGRGKQWVGRGGLASANGFSNVAPIGPDGYSTDANMAYTNMQICEQSEFNGALYDDFKAGYGQNDNWGKVAVPDVRGRGRAHPYSRPGIKLDQH